MNRIICCVVYLLFNSSIVSELLLPREWPDYPCSKEKEQERELLVSSQILV